MMKQGPVINYLLLKVYIVFPDIFNRGKKTVRLKWFTHLSFFFSFNLPCASTYQLSSLPTSRYGMKDLKK